MAGFFADPYALETPEQKRERERREVFERASAGMPDVFADMAYVPQSQINAQARREDQQRKARLDGPMTFYGSPVTPPAVSGAQAALRKQLAPTQPVNFTQGGPQQPAGMFKREAIPEKPQSQASGVLDFFETVAPAGVGLATTALDSFVPGLGSALAGPAAEATRAATQAGRGKTEKAKETLKRGAVKTAVDLGAGAISDDAAVDAPAKETVKVDRPGPSTVDASADAKALQRDRSFRRLREDSLTLTGRERAELLNDLTAEEAKQERDYRRAITLAQSPGMLERMIESGGIAPSTRENLAALGQSGLEEYDLFDLGDPTSADMRGSVKSLRGGFGKGAVSPLTGTLDYNDPETRAHLQRMAALGAPREQSYVQMVDDMAPSQYVAPERTGIPQELMTSAISPGRVDSGSMFVPTAATPVSLDAAMARQALVEDPNMVNAAGTQADRILSAFDELPELNLAESVDRAVAAVEANPQAQYAFQSPMSAPMAGVAPPQSQPMFEIGEQQLAEMGQLEYNMPQVPIQEFSPDVAVGPLPGAQVPSPSPMLSEDQQFLDRIATQNIQSRGPSQFSAFGGQQDMAGLPMESVGASQPLGNQNPVMAKDLGTAGQAYSSDYQKMVAPSNAPSVSPVESGPVDRAVRSAELELPESRFGIDQMRGFSSTAFGEVIDPINVRSSLSPMQAPSPRDGVMQLLPYTQAGQPADGVYLQRPVSGPLPPIDGATLTPPMTQMPPMTQTPQGLDGFMSLPMTRAAQPMDGVARIPGTTQLPPGFYIGADGYIRNALNQIVGM